MPKNLKKKKKVKKIILLKPFYTTKRCAENSEEKCINETTTLSMGERKNK